MLSGKTAGLPFCKVLAGLDRFVQRALQDQMVLDGSCGLFNKRLIELLRRKTSVFLQYLGILQIRFPVDFSTGLLCILLFFRTFMRKTFAIIDQKNFLVNKKFD